MDKQKSPTSLDLARKRKLASNPPPNGVKRSKGIVNHEPRSVSASQRVREFAGEHLFVLLGKLFCNACWETLSVKKSVLIQHVKSVKHATGKERLASKQARERNIADMLRKCDKDEHPIGETPSEEVSVYRIKVVTSFLKAGVPLSKIDCFRDLLEKNAFRFSQASNLSQLVPFIHQQQQIRVKNQINQQETSTLFMELPCL